MFNKTIDQWLDEYGESHQHKTNKLIHWIAVPVIMWTVLALLWSVQFASMPYANLATVFVVFCLVFYLTLSWQLMLGMLVITSACLGIIQWHEAMFTVPIWQTALTLFVVAWIFQFIGHEIEGKKPSFFKDVQFLLIGPAWLLSFIYQKIGISYSRHQVQH